MASAPLRNLLLTWFIVLVCALLSAEGIAKPETVVVQAYVCNTYPCSPPAKQSIFDDKIFDLTDKTPKTSLAVSGKERYLGPDFSYNYDQRDLWMKACSSKIDDDMRRFRDCFEKEHQKSAEDLSRSQDEIQKQRNAPHRNAYPSRHGKRKSKGPMFTALPK